MTETSNREPLDDLTGHGTEEFVELGEGIFGEYDPDNANDVELLRLDHLDNGEEIESTCALLPVSTSDPDRERALEPVRSVVTSNDLTTDAARAERVLGDLDVLVEVVVKLADGWTLRSGVYEPDAPDALTSGEFVRLVDPDGTEYAYWDQGEWATDPALVMGAIVNSAAGLALTGIATQLGTWPARISELERGRSRNDDLETNYRAWLSQVA